MSRILLAVPPLAGHLRPLVAVASALSAQGHQVAWAGDPGLVRSLAGPQAQVFPAHSPDVLDRIGRRPADLRGFAALRFLWEDVLVPLADDGVDRLSEVVAAFAPDVVLADQQTLAGALTALRHQLPWVTSVSTGAEFADSLAATPRIARWRADLLADLVTRHVPESASRAEAAGGPAPDPYVSPHLVLAFTTQALVGTGRAPARTVFAGPSLACRPESGAFPWHALREDRPVVLVTLGTVNADAGERFLTECAAAVAHLRAPAQFVIADPGGALPAGEQLGGNVLAVRHVPQLQLLSRVAAVICHGGHNTVCETLNAGVPLVLAPIRDDQPTVAQQVVDAGAGIRVRFGRVTAPQLAAAVDEVIRDPRYAAAAARIQRSFQLAGGAPRAAEAVARLASDPGRYDPAQGHGALRPGP